MISYKTINLAGLASVSTATVTVKFTTLLPLRFVNFRAKNDGAGVIINWTTSGEINAWKFEVQKSEDEQEFIC